MVSVINIFGNSAAAPAAKIDNLRVGIDFYDCIELVAWYKHYVFLLGINYNTKRWAYMIIPTQQKVHMNLRKRNEHLTSHSVSG